VTLLTDYGLDDPYVGIVKGVLWRDAPRLRAVVDLSHAVPPGDVTTAAFLLERSWATFPAGSVHVGIVDPGVGTARALLLVEARGHVFLAPDNGLLAPLIESEPLVVVRTVGASAPVRGPSTTFDGRDRFAPLAARLVEGDPPAAFGVAGAEVKPVPLSSVPRRLPDGSIAAEVVHVDRFGNLITNLPFIWLAEAGEDWRERWSCLVGERRLPLVRTYGDAAEASPVALVNSYDRLEVAVARGSAAGRLGLARGAEVRFVPREAATGAKGAKGAARGGSKAKEPSKPSAKEKKKEPKKLAAKAARKGRKS
jgi:S-adenosylmethionine hydrolase